MKRRKAKKIFHGYMQDNSCRLVHSGSDYFSLLLQLINEATQSVHLQVYIYEDDDTGKEVAAALMAAAQRNVKVYLMVDGYASGSLSKSFIKHITDGGVNFRFFDPLFKSRSFYFGRRMHHKIIVVDAARGMVGGINITNRYNDTPAHPAWLDFALYVEGQVAKEMCTLCNKTWKGFAGTPSEIVCIPDSTQQIPPDQNRLIRMRRNDWVRKKNQVSGSYLEMFSHATSHVTVLSSYFLPGNLFRRRLKKAVQRGVKVRIIIAGLSDVKLSKNAERFLYDWFIRNNIEIYEYEKNVLHGKLGTCDGEWMTIGSYNVNDISAFASIELNLDVRNKDFVTHTDQMLEQIIREDCTRVTREHLAATTNIFKKFIRWTSYKIFRGIFYLFTFYFRQTK
jgi:cardiolipin synthase A/B